MSSSSRSARGDSENAVRGGVADLEARPPPSHQRVMESETMSETTHSTVVALPARKLSDDPVSRSTTCPTEELCDHQPYLTSLRSQLADAYSAFEDRRLHAITEIESALETLANDRTLETTRRQRLMRSFEQQLARIKALEAYIPHTHREALAVLDRLEARARSRRTARR